MAGTHVRINLTRYRENIAHVLEQAGSERALMAVLKADAYGHGLVEMARVAMDAGATMVGVARVAEGARLRDYGFAGQIALMGPTPIGEFSRAYANDLTLAIGSEYMLEEFLETTRPSDKRRVHVEVETGMNRHGFRPEQMPDVVKRLMEAVGEPLDGIFSHFSSADEIQTDTTEDQLQRFEACLEDLDREGILPRWRHIANSPGTLTEWWGSTNLVRSGILTYGLWPSSEVPADERFQPIMSMHSKVVRRSTLGNGEYVSYNRGYFAESDHQIADLCVGYADGFPRSMARQGWIAINGEKCPILGSVCMDQLIVRVPDSVREGDEAVAYGDGSRGEMTANEIARLVHTSSYDVVSSVTARVPRLYFEDGECVAWEHLSADARATRPA